MRGHAWGSPKAAWAALAVPKSCSFDAGASATTRADTQHLVHDAPRPLRRGRTRWMPTALGSVIWEFRQEASSRPGQGRRGSRGGPRAANRRHMREKTRRRFRRLT